jgi:hypothetical protein
MISLWIGEHLGLMGVAIFALLSDMFIVHMSVIFSFLLS